ncbi:MAG: penicillin-binding protein [Nanoarchaeota archaeon]|nr:penicillin-binding protein [DPANN group archaeon]MBL7116425.1 penicillin-binding protein [Nanoarchaeota archaeon]
MELSDRVKKWLKNIAFYSSVAVGSLALISYANNETRFIEKNLGKAMVWCDENGFFTTSGYLWDQIRAYNTLENIVLNGTGESTTSSGFLLPSATAIQEFPKSTGKNITILDEENRSLATIRSTHESYSLEEFPPFLKSTIIVKEDRRFLKHYGVSWTALARAFAKDIMSMSRKQGGSTITMQVAKHFYKRKGANYSRSIFRKSKEILTAIELERLYTKKELFEFYMNNICEFGNRVVGFGDAAEFYFNKSLEDLTKAEMTFLAVIPNNPAQHPYRSSGIKTIRSNQERLLEQLVKAEKLTEEERSQIIEETESFRFKRKTNIIQSEYTYIVDVINQRLLQALEQEKIPTDELNLIDKDALVRQAGNAQIYTTLNLDLMRDLKRIVDSRGLGSSQDFAYIVIGADNGEIKAVYTSTGLGENSTLNWRMQTGSSFVKPLVYGFAFKHDKLRYDSELDDRFAANIVSDDKGLGVTFAIDDTTAWTVHNSTEDFFQGRQPWHQHLANSNNIIAAKLIQDLHNGNKTGPTMVMEVVSLLGTDLSRYGTRDDIYSSVLGTFEQTPLEVAYGFAVFDEGRIIMNPTNIHSLLIKNINILGKEFEVQNGAEYKQVLDEEDIPYLQTAMWTALRVGGYHAFGKTGTSQQIYTIHGKKTNSTWYNVFMRTKKHGDIVLTCFATGDDKVGRYGAEVHGKIVKEAVRKWAVYDNHYANLEHKLLEEPERIDVALEPEPVEITGDIETVLNNYLSLNRGFFTESKSRFLRNKTLKIEGDLYRQLAAVSSELGYESRKKYMNAINSLYKGVSVRSFPLLKDVGDVMTGLREAEQLQRRQGSTDSINIVRKYIRREVARYR